MMRPIPLDLTAAIPLGLRDRFRAFLAREQEPHPTGAGRDIYHLKTVSLPQYRFEWHPKKRIVYLIRVGTKPEIGEAIAFNIETHGDAHNAVLIWSRGYAEGQAPTAPKLHLRD
jgi:hypothetical protein